MGRNRTKTGVPNWLQKKIIKVGSVERQYLNKADYLLLILMVLPENDSLFSHVHSLMEMMDPTQHQGNLLRR